MSFFKRAGSIFLDIIETIVIALAIFVIVYLFLFQPHQVNGNSMFPNFHDGDYLLTDKISYHLSDPKRDDVVIFTAPRNEDYDYIKRIIALPGETIKLEEEKILINNNPLEQPYLNEEITFGGNFLKIGEETIVPEDNYFVLGDNRSHSSDSRDWGFVPKDNIIGKAWLRYWPLSDIGLITKIP